MISDSFGVAAAPVFAGAFCRLVHVNTNDLVRGEIPRLIRRLDYIAPFDRVIVIFNEGNVYRAVDSLAT